MQLFTIGCPEARDKVIGDYDEYNSRLRICSNEMNPIWPDAQPYDNLLYVAVAVVVEKEFGSICPGKTADLAIIDGDPLQDFHLIGRPVQALFMDGQVVVNRCGLRVGKA